MRRLTLLLAAAMLAAAAGSPQAAGDNKSAVITEGQASEEALLEALAPPAEGSRTRQFRPGIRAEPPKASLLITFVTGSAQLTDGARSTLDVLARALKNERLADRRFTIEGHADPRGSATLNQRLSQARAEGVRDYLVGRHGLDAARLEPVGKGSSEPMKPENPAAPENRRVTVVANPI